MGLELLQGSGDTDGGVGKFGLWGDLSWCVQGLQRQRQRQGAGAVAATGVQPGVLPGVLGWEARDLGPRGPMNWSWISQAQK